MCRFALYLGSEITVSSLVTEPSNSLIHQSYDNQERTEPLNGDGFGIAWYVPELDRQPALFRSVSPAWSDHNLGHLARVTRSGCEDQVCRMIEPGEGRGAVIVSSERLSEGPGWVRVGVNDLVTISKPQGELASSVAPPT